MIKKMPRYLVSINGTLEARVRSVIAEGVFLSLDHLVEVALENQLKAEEDGQRSWGTGRGAPILRGPARPARSVRAREREDLKAATVVASSSPAVHSPNVNLDLRMPEGEVPTVTDPDPSAVAGPLLWGQHYKFLPAKAALRVLARMASNKPPLGTFSENASSVAVALGERLRSIDRAQGRKLGDQVATSFPEGNEKSVHRFRDQYLAYLRPSDRRIDGMLPRLRFVAIYSEDGSNRIGLTSAGREFARLQNPVIDAGADGPSLSEEEVSYLLHHIEAKLPAEAKHMSAILRLTSQGATSPEELNKKIERFYKDFQNSEKPWTEAHVNTMRAGVTSRLFELGLLTKEKEGVAVSYHPTGRGIGWLAQFDKQN